MYASLDTFRCNETVAGFYHCANKIIKILINNSKMSMQVKLVVSLLQLTT